MSKTNLTSLFRLTHMVMIRNLEDVSEEDALKKPEYGGSSINFVLGHIVVTRDNVLNLLGMSGLCPGEMADSYARGSNAPGTNPVTLKELLLLYNTSQDLILNRIDELTEEELQRPTENSNLIQELFEYYFHETYHAGQIGILRRAAGKPGALR